MKIETKDSVTFRFNDDELVEAIATMIRLKEYLEKKNKADDLVKDLDTAIEAMEWVYCELFGEKKDG